MGGVTLACAAAPAAILMSSGFTPLAATWTTTSPGPGDGRSTLRSAGADPNSSFRSAVTASLTARGLPGPAAAAEAAKVAQLQGGSGDVAAIPLFIRADFAAATQDVLYAMAAIMALAALVALRGLRRGVQDEDTVDAAAPVAVRR